jgi:hypothetical protein
MLFEDIFDNFIKPKVLNIKINYMIDTECIFDDVRVYI